MAGLGDDVAAELVPGRRGGHPRGAAQRSCATRPGATTPRAPAPIGPAGDPRRRRRQRLPGARDAGPAGGRRLGLPAHPRLLHRHRDLHGGGEGQRRDPRRRGGRRRAAAVPDRPAARPRPAAPPAQARPLRPPSRRPDEHRDPRSTNDHPRVRAAAARRLRRAPEQAAARPRRRPCPGADYRRTPFWRVYDRVAQAIDHRRGWDKLPLPAGLAVLIGVRDDPAAEEPARPVDGGADRGRRRPVPRADAGAPRQPAASTARYNDLDHPDDGHGRARGSAATSRWTRCCR